MKNKYLIDNHEVELHFKEDCVKIYWYYNNNWNCTEFLYNIEEKRFFAFQGENILTDRQRKILTEKIEIFVRKNKRK